MNQGRQGKRKSRGWGKRRHQQWKRITLEGRKEEEEGHSRRGTGRRVMMMMRRHWHSWRWWERWVHGWWAVEVEMSWEFASTS
jgi:hypothetical protein